MIITVSALNQLENKFAPNGLGVEIITPSELTYNKALNAVNNGLLPVLKITDSNETIFYLSTQVTYASSKYYVNFDGYYYEATSATAIMTQIIPD